MNLSNFLRRHRKVGFYLFYSAPFIVFSLGLGGWFSETGAADVYLGISRPEAKKIHVAATGFSAQIADPKGESLTPLALKTLRSDLDFTEAIDLVDPASLPFEPTSVRFGQEKDFLPRLGGLNIQVMLVAELVKSQNRVSLEAKLFDVSTQGQIFYNRYLTEPRSLRSAVHRLSDDIIYYLTGERGIARTKIAFASNKTGAKEIYVMDLDGGNVMLMTRNDSLNLTPRWSPDGRFLAYVSYRDNNPDLYLLDVTVGRRTKISSLPGLNISPAWAPDGKSMALALSKNGTTDIYLMHIDGKGLRRLTSTNAITVSPSWSPNGRQLAFVSDQGGSPQIYLMDAEGTNIRRLTFKGNYNTSPAWSPRGDKIAFVSRQNGRFEICVMNPDGSGLRVLTGRAGDNESPAWSPDGRYIVYSSTRQGKSGIYFMREDGSGQRRLTPEGSDYFTPDWSLR
jgi:TolB protein